MDDAARAAFLMAQAVCAIARIEAMKVDNEQDRAAGRPLTHSSTEFEAVPAYFGLEHNTAVAYLRG